MRVRPGRKLIDWRKTCQGKIVPKGTFFPLFLRGFVTLALLAVLAYLLMSTVRIWLKTRCKMEMPESC